MKITVLWIWVAVLIGVAGMGLVVAMYFSQEAPYPPTESGIACTMEAKLCSDGSYVGRTGPRCEFTACPGE